MAKRTSKKKTAHSKTNPTIGKLIDAAMLAIERDNPSLKGTLPNEFNRPSLDKHRLGELEHARTEPRPAEPQFDGAVITDPLGVLACVTYAVGSLFRGGAMSERAGIYR